jgi:hypothetical protein
MVAQANTGNGIEILGYAAFGDQSASHWGEEGIGQCPFRVDCKELRGRRR